MGISFTFFFFCWEREEEVISADQQEVAFSEAAAVVGFEHLRDVADDAVSRAASDAESLTLASMPTGWTAMRWLAFVRHAHGGDLEAAKEAAERAAANERRRSVAALLDPDVGGLTTLSSRRF